MDSNIVIYLFKLLWPILILRSDIFFIKLPRLLKIIKKGKDRRRLENILCGYINEDVIDENAPIKKQIEQGFKELNSIKKIIEEREVFLEGYYKQIKNYIYKEGYTLGTLLSNIASYQDRLRLNEIDYIFQKADLVGSQNVIIAKVTDIKTAKKNIRFMKEKLERFKKEVEKRRKHPWFLFMVRVLLLIGLLCWLSVWICSYKEQIFFYLSYFKII